VSDEITSERLDALLDGSATPETDSERDMLHLAARMRDGSPRASDALRRRVQALEGRTAVASAPRRPRWLPATSRGWMMLGAPALSALLIAVIGVGVLSTRDGSDDTAGGGSESSLDSVARSGSATPAEGTSEPSTATTTPTLPATPNFAQERFGTINQLNAASTDVVIGVVGSARREVSRSADGQVVRVVSPFAVTRVVRGRLVAGQSIDVIRTVRAETGVPAATADSPQLRDDGEYVVFLTRAGVDPVFTPLGPDSAWPIAGDQVTIPGSAGLSDSGSVEGRSVDQTVATLQALPMP
jgi:hypothetical protein